MAEIRKHNPDAADGLGKLVRDALGGGVRPHEPGRREGGGDQSSPEPETDAEGTTASSIPVWPSDGPAYTF